MQTPDPTFPPLLKGHDIPGTQSAYDVACARASAGELGAGDVIDETNKDAYWLRSDRFVMVVDFRFTQPALDAFARVAEAWIEHFLRLEVRIEPRQSIKDEQWSWHIGMDRTSNRILNTLYEGKELAPGDDELLIALFRMRVEDDSALVETMRSKPIYLGLAMNPQKIIKMKPQNLLMNMPLPREA